VSGVSIFHGTNHEQQDTSTSGAYATLTISRLTATIWVVPHS